MKRAGPLLTAALLVGCGDPPTPMPVESGRSDARTHPGRHDPHQPTVATLEAIDAMTAPLEVGLYVEREAKGREHAISYFRELTRLRERVTVVQIGAGNSSTDAKRFAGYGDNGIVLRYGQRTAYLAFGRFAKNQGDAQLRRVLSKLARPEVRVAVAGDAAAEGSKHLPRLTAPLGASPVFVEPDAPLPPSDLVVLLQRGAVSKERLEQVLAHFEGGGALVLAFDPPATATLEPLLAKLGVSVEDPPVAQPGSAAAPDDNPLAVPRFSHSGNVAKHRSVSSVLKLGKTLEITLLSPATLTTPNGSEAILTVLPPPGAWLDTNANGQRDPDEADAKAVGWVAAVETGLGRAVVAGDADVFLDPLVSGVASNRTLLEDTLTWVTSR